MIGVGGSRSNGRQIFLQALAVTGIALPPEDRALALALADQLGTVLANETQY